MVFTFVANLRLHKVSPRCVAKGDKLHNIRVLLEPANVSARELQSAKDFRNSPERLVCSNRVRVEFL